MAMDTAVVKALEAIRQDQSLAINAKAQKICGILQQKGLLYEQQIHASLLVVHHQNRSGMMLNSFDCHKTGVAALKVGWQEAKLSESLCFEISADNHKKETQLDAMRGLVVGAENRLAPVSGKERFRTVSSSHISQFAKAVHFGQCSSELPELKQFTVEALHMQFKDDEFARLVRHGWTWRVISSHVEDSCPWLPQLLQHSLNTDHGIGQTPTEIEVALNVAFHYKSLGSLEQAVKMCSSSCPLSYLQAIATFAKNFGGGQDFPLLHFLQSVQKLLGASLFLGEEFMTCLSQLDFKCKSSTFPMLRCAAICANISSPKSQDKVGKLLFVTDLQKLKSLVKQGDKLATAEAMVKLCWEQVYKIDPKFEDKEAVKILARLCIRTVLFLCNKQGKGKETRIFESLLEIKQTFEEEVGKGSSSCSSIPEMPVEQVEQQLDDTKVWSLQDSFSLFFGCGLNIGCFQWPLV